MCCRPATSRQAGCQVTAATGWRIVCMENTDNPTCACQTNRYWDRLKNYRVVCYLCDRLYPVVMDRSDGEEPNQGNTCCTSIYKLNTGEPVITCGYGSDYDLSSFLIVNGELADSLMLNATIGDIQHSVCDNCIIKNVVEGKLQPIDDESIDGPVSVKAMTEVWPHWAIVPNSNQRDELTRAHRTIDSLEYQLAKQSSHSAWWLANHRLEEIGRTLLSSLVKYQITNAKPGYHLAAVEDLLYTVKELAIKLGGRAEADEA